MPALQIAGFLALAGDHGHALLLAGPFVHVEELVEEVRSDVFGLLVDGTGVFRGAETSFGDT